MKRKSLLLICVLALIIGLLGWFYTENYVLIAGKTISREAPSVDLRDAKMSLKHYQKLQNALPDCYVRWNVPFQGQLYDSTTQELNVTTLSAEDLSVLELFPELQVLNAMDCTDYDLLLDFSSRHPNCDVLYQIPLNGETYSNDIRELTVQDSVFEDLKATLPHLPGLKKLHLTGSLPELAQIEELCSLYPQVEIRWDIPLGERILSSKLYHLDLSGIPMTYGETVELLKWLPNTKDVNMIGSGLTDAEMMQLADEHPDIFFLWEMTFGTLLLPTNLEEIDISGQKMESTSEIEDLLPYFPKVKKVVMSHCGFDDETMDALDKRYDDIRFVWSIQVQEVFIRTDTKYFYPYKYRSTMDVNDEDLVPLRYLIDCECVDIGHMWAVTHCEWARYMPKLKYFIIIDSQITDLSPLSNCKDLRFLEIFRTPVMDYSPLLNCTALEDLNLCHTYGDYTPISQMTWLKTVYWTGIKGTYGLPCSGAHLALPEALPNTRLKFDGEASSWRNGWRLLKNYKDMRDLMDMFYLS